MPEKSVTVRPKDKPLFNTYQKNRLEHKALKSYSPLDWDKFKSIRNKFNNMI